MRKWLIGSLRIQALILIPVGLVFLGYLLVTRQFILALLIAMANGILIDTVRAVRRKK